MALYKLGSLNTYLRENTISLHQMFRIMQSIVEALEYLHHPVISAVGQNHYGIAHCDLHPGNIFLNDINGTCVVGDFGLSLIGEDFTNKNNVIAIQRGMKCYRAPEILSENVNTTELHSFCMADIYAVGLILWVVWRRVETTEGQSLSLPV